MKTLFTIFGLTVLLSVASPGQTAPDTVKMQRQQHQRKGFIDRNGDGINDRRQQRQGNVKRRTDRFIDADGDGISDGRECGLGLRRGPAAGKGIGKQGSRQSKGGKQ